MDIAPPPAPAPAPPPPFPVLGVAAPVVVSVAVWAITRSPTALLFAALGPVAAVAGVVDQRVSGRRAARRAVRERQAALGRLHREVRGRLDRARADMEARAPSAREILDGRANPALLWRADAAGPGAAPALVLGTGAVPSGMVWRGEADAAPPGPAAADGGRVRLAGRRRACARPRDRRTGACRTGADSLRWTDLVEWIPDAPVLVHAGGGLGLRGRGPLLESVLRGAIVQLVHALPPDDLRITARPPGHEWEWLDALPHAAGGVRVEPWTASASASASVSGSGSEDDGAVVRLRRGARDIVLAAATRVEALPAACRTVLDVRGPGAARILAADPAPGDRAAASGAMGDPPSPAGGTGRADATGDDDGRGAGPVARVTRSGLVRPELVSLTEATRLADELADLARHRGLEAARAPLPGRVRFADLASEAADPAADPYAADPDSAGPRSAGRRTLPAVLGIGHQGIVRVDLVADGPHAVVAGTTGSGKSELLVTWMAALAAAHDPEEVTILLVDFKGGAAFDPLLVLPHAVGLVTDLDGQGARRALESLRAEIRHRERTLREAGARDLDDPAAAGVLPRLVIVVDELAALLADQDGLHEVVADIAARGRSLGMHLVLCTQRPGGVVRDAVLANCDLRLSLRVNNEADSRALLGTTEAARLADAPPGRCLVGAHGAPARPFQVAVTTADDLARLASRSTPDAPVRRPWLDPLPPVVPLAALAGVPLLGAATPTVDPGPASRSASLPSAGAIPPLRFALVDLPAEQRRAAAAWHPATGGHLVVIGGPGSGRSTCLSAVAESAREAGVPVHVVPSDPEGCWDALMGVQVRVRAAAAARAPLVVVADDLDVAVSRLEAEHQAAVLEAIAGIVREGPHAGVALAVSGRRPGGPLQSVAAAAGPPVVLALPTRQEHLLAGGDPALFDPRATPGAGAWRGERIQVALPPCPEEGLAAGPATATAPASDPAPPVVLDARTVHALVTPVPGEARERLAGSGLRATDVGGLPAGWTPDQDAGGVDGDTGTARIVIGDADAWLVRGALLAELRRRGGSVMLEGCAPRDVRTLLRTRQVPPPLASVPGRVWLVAPDGLVHRRRWPVDPHPGPRPEPPAGSSPDRRRAGLSR